MSIYFLGQDREIRADSIPIYGLTFVHPSICAGRQRLPVKGCARFCGGCGMRFVRLQTESLRWQKWFGSREFSKVWKEL
jgi:hypothetical protein